jgi:3',5'-nucleoside bisphosphate phosphatase
MVGKLAALGVPVTWEQVERIAAGGVVGRPHIARAMTQAGVIASPGEAFTEMWIGTGGRAHVSRYALDPAQAVRLLGAAGGVSALAHPLASTRGWLVPEDLVGELAGAGMSGLEVEHPDHGPADRDRLRALAQALGLAATGGSDDHGALTGDRIGSETTPADQLSRLLAGATGATAVTG